MMIVESDKNATVIRDVTITAQEDQILNVMVKLLDRDKDEIMADMIRVGIREKVAYCVQIVDRGRQGFHKPWQPDTNS